MKSKGEHGESRDFYQSAALKTASDKYFLKK